MNLFEQLERLCRRPAPYEFYTADSLWTDEHISVQMLKYHLNETVDLASRNHAFIDRSASWIIDQFKLGEGASVCDFGCGPGLYTSRFARSGANITGIDFSRSSVDYARKTAAETGLKIDYVLQDYLDFDTDKKYDLITMIFCDFCPLSPAQRKQLLGKFRDILKDDGTVLLDVLTLKHLEATEEQATFESAPEGGFWSAAPYYVLANTFKYPKDHLVLSKHTIVEESRTREIYNWLQCFSRESLKAEFADNGLEIAELFSDVGGGKFDPESSQMAVVARKT